MEAPREKCENIHDQSGKQVLVAANGGENHVDMVRELLKHQGIEVSIQDRSGKEILVFGSTQDQDAKPQAEETIRGVDEEPEVLNNWRKRVLEDAEPRVLEEKSRREVVERQLLAKLLNDSFWKREVDAKLLNNSFSKKVGREVAEQQLWDETSWRRPAWP